MRMTDFAAPLTAFERDVFGRPELRESFAQGVADIRDGRVMRFQNMEDLLRDLGFESDAQQNGPAAA